MYAFAAAKGHEASAVKPLCVDLDGTIVLGDTFVDCLRNYVRQHPLSVIRIGLGLLRNGRAHTKRTVAAWFPEQPTGLRFCEPLIQWLVAARKSGRKLILVTGADQSIADTIASRLGIFDEVYGSNGALNLTGKRKASALVERFGEQGFDYAGDSLADLHVWRRASNAIVVNPGFVVRLLLFAFRIRVIHTISS